MIKSVLIANRGEIACRVIKTARLLGVKTIAVYADSDAKAQHVLQADIAYPLNGQTAHDTYLNQNKIIEIAKASGAEAIHPGYGFLSENASFADAVAKAGLIFMGPTAATMRVMGDKAMAKQKVAGSGVPTLPGYEGEDQAESVLIAAAEKIGFPLIIKPAAGGGGKGMKVVKAAAELPAALQSAKREAESSFGSSRLILERYLASPRHIEVQIFGDTHGHVVSLFERECTLQRRHQKIIEEAPGVNLPDSVVKPIHEAAVQAGLAVNYVGAGTVEFLLDGDKAYFMEMNTRLQVEHPVTEMITGLDLVAWQFKVANGESLPVQDIPQTPSGHAIEARIYAEDPAANFLPSTGKISVLHFPTDCRVDTGVVEGDTITHLFDPMIAKLIVHADTREEALQKMDAALKQTHIGGIKSNVGFLTDLVNNPVIHDWKVDVTYIDRNLDSLINAVEVHNHLYVMAALTGILERQATKPQGPWDDRTGFRINIQGQESVRLHLGDQDVQLSITRTPTGFVVCCKGVNYLVAATLQGSKLSCVFDDKTTWLSDVYLGDDVTHLFHEGHSYTFKKSQRHLGDGVVAAVAGSTMAPMTGKVVDVLVHTGDIVEKGAKLVIMEAMKMEHVIKADKQGTVTAVHFKVGDVVEEGKELLSIDYKEAS